jgi:AcrR family transcriptional regulator
MSLATAQRGLGVVGRERLVEIQRARMLAAMVEVCADRGVANCTVADVVSRSGVSRRTFYEVFDDIQDCYLAAFGEATSRVSRVVLDAYDSDDKWVDRVRAPLTALLGFLDTDRRCAKLLIVESLSAGADVSRERARQLERAVRLIDEGRSQSKAGGELFPLVAEGVVGGVLAVVHARLLEERSGSLLELAGPLTSMIVLPYLGAAAARRELERPVPAGPAHAAQSVENPLAHLGMRLTYRTVRVLMAIAEQPGSSNRRVADTAGISDQGQMSKLLTRLDRLGLIHNAGTGATRGEPNAWTLTSEGWRIQSALSGRDA